MRAARLVTMVGVAATSVVAAPAGAQPAPLDAVSRDYPACRAGAPAPTVEDVAAAKGLHAAARRHFERGAFEAASRRWGEAYRLDCSAHRLLLNLARAEGRRGRKARAWALRALYVARTGRDAAAPEIVAMVDRDRPPDPHRPRFAASEASLSTEVWPTRGAGTVVAFAATLRAALTSDVVVDVVLPAVVWFDPDALADPRGDDVEDVRAGAGNPRVGVGYTHRWFTGGLVGGGRLGVPLTSIDDIDAQTAAGLAGDVYGWTELGLWAPARVPGSGFVAVDQRVSGPFSVGAEAETTVLLPLGRGAYRMADRGVDVALEGGVEGRVEFPLDGPRRHRLYGDLGGHVVYVPTFGGDDAQATLRFGVGYRGPALSARIGTRWGLDEPLGWAFRDRRLATVAVSIGVPIPGLADAAGSLASPP